MSEYMPVMSGHVLVMIPMMTQQVSSPVKPVKETILSKEVEEDG